MNLLTDEIKIAYIDGRSCPGCGFEPEPVHWYKREDQPAGYHDSCGTIVIDHIVVGGSPNF